MLSRNIGSRRSLSDFELQVGNRVHIQTTGPDMDPRPGNNHCNPDSVAFAPQQSPSAGPCGGKQEPANKEPSLEREDPHLVRSCSKPIMQSWWLNSCSFIAAQRRQCFGMSLLPRRQNVRRTASFQSIARLVLQKWYRQKLLMRHHTCLFVPIQIRSSLDIIPYILMLLDNLMPD